MSCSARSWGPSLNKAKRLSHTLCACLSAARLLPSLSCFSKAKANFSPAVCACDVTHNMLCGASSRMALPASNKRTMENTNKTKNTSITRDSIMPTQKRESFLNFIALPHVRVATPNDSHSVYRVALGVGCVGILTKADLYPGFVTARRSWPRQESHQMRQSLGLGS